MKISQTIHKTLSLVLCIGVLFSIMLTASATSSDISVVSDEVEEELFLPNGKPTLLPIPQSESIPVRDLPSVEEMLARAPMLIPSTANEFKIVELRIYPVVIKNGEYTHLDGTYQSFRPSSGSKTNLMAQMTLAKQQTLIDYATANGYETVGWYLTGQVYMNCYMPHWVEYRVYNHEVDGSDALAETINRAPGYASFSTTALFPSDRTQDYIYGFQGRGVMTVYYSTSNSTETLYPRYVMKATFTNS